MRYLLVGLGLVRDFHDVVRPARGHRFRYAKVYASASVVDVGHETDVTAL